MIVTEEIEETPDVVIMDDQAVIVRVLSENLRDRLEGVRIRPVATGAEAVGLVHRTRCFVLDVNMGEGRETEGLDTLKALKAQDPNAAVVLFTGEGNLKKYSARVGPARPLAFLEKTPEWKHKVTDLVARVMGRLENPGESTPVPSDVLARWMTRLEKLADTSTSLDQDAVHVNALVLGLAVRGLRPNEAHLAEYRRHAFACSGCRALLERSGIWNPGEA